MIISINIAKDFCHCSKFNDFNLGVDVIFNVGSSSDSEMLKANWVESTPGIRMKNQQIYPFKCVVL